MAGPPPMLDGRLACYRVYRCKDGRGLSVAALEPKFWRRFCEALGRPEWMDGQMMPGAHVAEVGALIETRPAAAWAELLAEHDCCVELVLLPQEVPLHPQHRARGVFTGDGALRLPVLERVGGGTEKAPTDLRTGAETRAVLREAGLSDAEIDTLVDAGAVAEAE